MDALMQAVQWYLLKSVTAEISNANFDSAGNKKNGRTGVVGQLHFLRVLVENSVQYLQIYLVS